MITDTYSVTNKYERSNRKFKDGFYIMSSELNTKVIGTFNDYDSALSYARDNFKSFRIRDHIYLVGYDLDLVEPNNNKTIVTNDTQFINAKYEQQFKHMVLKQLFLTWQKLVSKSYSKPSDDCYGLPVQLTEIASDIDISFKELTWWLEVVITDGYQTDYELIPARNKNYPIGNRRVASMTFYSKPQSL